MSPNEQPRVGSKVTWGEFLSYVAISFALTFAARWFFWFIGLNFEGVQAFSSVLSIYVTYLIVRHWRGAPLFAVAGFLGLCLPLSAQTLGPQQPFFDGGALSRPFPGFPSLALTDQDRVSFMTAFNWQTPVDFLPSFKPVQPQSVAFPATLDPKDSFDDVVELRASNRVYVGGEVGFFYGKSTGKYGREDFQTYIIGTVGNEKFSITAGILHQESSGHFPRWRR